MTHSEHLQNINEFESHYQYDSGYMRELLASSPQAYQHFADFLPMAHFRELLTPEDYWIAKIAVMQVADCGACLQLNIRMAQEQGVAGDLILALLNAGDSLTPGQRELRDYARQLVMPAGVEPALMQTMQARYSRGQLLEFGLCAASAMVFPTIKRAIAEIQSCVIPEIEVA
ncbi:hypothetical protein SG34_010040 [Thalassomonas viridans]|uniref:Carboxymuconolactone decarboxylase-like domain-containing protein n=1 Tax=Thalassomonas viridans TaxID=137584 RepID=A0AAF0C970_9GAMM|nr:hypothetical protein [Thalassomonas viridans]WDE07197.1 hypothetical protein SG34_010040 [Thalassomonas viridans]